MSRRHTAAMILTLLTLTSCRAFNPPTTTGTAEATTYINPHTQGDATLTTCGPGTMSTVIVRNTHATTADYTITVDYRTPTGTLTATGTLHLPTMHAGETRTAPIPAPAGSLTATQCILTAATAH